MPFVIDAQHDAVLGLVEQLGEAAANHHTARRQGMLHLARTDHQRAAAVAEQAVR